MSALYRYPGVKPFEPSDAALFFGRDRDRIDLLDLTQREQLILLFGKSGYGKSSLLKAGLVTDLMAKPYIIVDTETGEDVAVPNCPIYIRFNLYGKDKQSVMPCATLTNKLKELGGANDINPNLQAFFEQKNLGNTLWSTFKTSNLAAKQRVFLIFDQFEEFFSYPSDEQVLFRQQLSELLYTRIPQAVRDAMSDLGRAEKSQLHRPLEVHTIFAIRSDRMHLLNSMREELPAILQTRYELKALTELQAEAAIVRPAQLTGDQFLLRQPFVYEPSALHKIISELSKANPNTTELEPQSQIEAFQLQMVCQTIEQNLITKAKKSKGVQPLAVKEADLPNFEQIYEQYYEDKMSDLPDNTTRKIAHTLLEEEMVIGQDMSDIRRMSIDKDLLRETMSHNHAMALTQDIFDYLEDKFLIRRETIGGRIHYEVSHDVLLAPLLKSRSETRQKAAEIEARAQQRAQQAAAEQRAADAEAMAAQERLARIEADRRRKRARMLAVGAILGLILASVFGILAFGARDKAKTLQAVAEQNEKDAKDQQRNAEEALKLVIEIKKEKINNQINLDKSAQFYSSESQKRNLLHVVDSLERIKAPLSEILLILEKKQ